MPSLAVSNTFTGGTTAQAAEVNTNFSDIVSYVNNRNGGTTDWQTIRGTDASLVPLVADNSTGTQDIAQFKDNGTTVFHIENGSITAVLDSTGLGVGTASPGTICHVYKTTDGNVYTKLENPNSGSSSVVGVQLSTASNNWYLQAERNNDVFRILQNADDQMNMSASGVVFNEGGAVGFDFRIESDTNANMFFLDSGANIAIFGAASTTTGTTTFSSGGGVQVGAPTGNDKGSGTINVATEIYKNDTAYANPDYAFEFWATGKIEKFKDNDGAFDYKGTMALDDLISYCKKNLDLPRVKSVGADKGGAQGIFSRADVVLEKLEEAYIYIFQLHERIKTLESAKA